MEEEYWEKEMARSIAILLRGDLVLDRDERGHPVTDDTFYVVFNGYEQDREVVLPPSSYGKAWEMVLDTAAEDPMPAQGWPFQAGRVVPVSGRSVLVLRRLD
jgi:isoamylase